MDWKSPKFALYLVGGLALVVGLWGLLAFFVPSLAFGLALGTWWVNALKVLLGIYAVWVGTTA